MTKNGILKVKLKNNSQLQVDSDDKGILYELKEHFSFFIDGYRHMPRFKLGVWNGSISLFNLTTSTIPAGLYEDVVEFCKVREYELDLIDSPAYGLPGTTTNILPEDIVEYVKSLEICSKGQPLEVREYQLDAIHKSLLHRRQLILAPTGSGKSLIIYSIMRYLIDVKELKVLLIVPNKQLVFQMRNDFEDYSTANEYDVEENTQLIMGGYEKVTTKNLIISTWQSLSQSRVPASWFQVFDAVLVDETHGAKGKEIQNILDKCGEAKYRYGFTGSLDNSKVNELLIKGMLGPIYKVTSTKKLIDDGHLANTNIKCVMLSYSKETKSLLKGADYNLEVKFLCDHNRRNKFIVNLAMSLEGNTIILYTKISGHGDKLDKLFKDRVKERPYFYIHGGVDASERDELRPIVENSNNAIVLGSYGVLSTGVNIRKIHNIILAAPTKSVIRLLQSVGRGLRTSEGKSSLTIYDISDKINNSKTKSNYTYTHAVDRMKIYSKEEFSFSLVEVAIES